MRTKRFAALVMALVMCFSFAARAEGVWGWLTGAVDDAAAWAEKAAGDVTAWAEKAADDAGAWVEKAAGDAAAWVQTAADDAAAWAQEAADNAWSWAETAAQDAGAAAAEVYGIIKDAVLEYGDDAIEVVKSAYAEVCRVLGIASESIQELWADIEKYAAEHDIPVEKLVKLACAVLSGENGQIEAGSDAGELWNTVANWLDDLGVTDETSADAVIRSIEAALGE